MISAFQRMRSLHIGPNFLGVLQIYLLFCMKHYIIFVYKLKNLGIPIKPQSNQNLSMVCEILIIFLSLN